MPIRAINQRLVIVSSNTEVGTSENTINPTLATVSGWWNSGNLGRWRVS
jgi:hypothetical protein